MGNGRSEPLLSRMAAVEGIKKRLQQVGNKDAARQARHLVCVAAGLDITDLLRDPQKSLDVAAQARLEEIFVACCQGMPMSRIRGRREFWGLDLAISADVLDPRADSEALIESVLARCDDRMKPYRLIDFGTGSGALLCALLTELPAAFGVGVDRSPAACAVAQANLAACGLRSRAAVLSADWAQGLNIGDPANQFDVVVSNPPYIVRDEIAGLEPSVRNYDPHLALDGGVDGLEAYRCLFACLPRLLCDEGFAAFEMGYDQGLSLHTLAVQMGLTPEAKLQDLAGNDRIWVLRLGRNQQ